MRWSELRKLSESLILFSLGLSRMEFRVGAPPDAEAIARLIASFQSELTDDPSGAGAEVFLDSVSVEAEREYLASTRYRYLLAYSGSRLAGFIAIRDGSHLFHLFIEPSYQRQGIARRLWERALSELCPPAAMEASRSTRAFPRCPYMKPSALFQQAQCRGSMASPFCRCGVRRCSTQA